MGTAPSVCAVNNPDGTITYIEQGLTESQRVSGVRPKSAPKKAPSRKKSEE